MVSRMVAHGSDKLGPISLFTALDREGDFDSGRPVVETIGKAI